VKPPYSLGPEVMGGEEKGRRIEKKVLMSRVLHSEDLVLLVAKVRERADLPRCAWNAIA